MSEIKKDCTFVVCKKMKRNKQIIIMLTLVLATGFSCFGQKHEAGLNGGISYYLGDINPGKHFLESDYTFGVYYRHNFSRRISLRASVNYAQFHSADAKTKEDIYRNAWFKSNIIDVSVMAEINFLPFFIGARESVWSPYLVGGISAGLPLKTEGGFLNDTYSFTNGILNTPSGSSIGKKNIIIPNLAIGFGVKFSLSKNFGMHVEWVMHKTFIDWMDGIYYYNDEAFFKDNNIQYICNTSNQDWYSLLQVGVSYKFKVREARKCIDHLENF